MAWASPDASALGTGRMPGVVGSAVRASQRYAADQRITTNVASWPFAGAATRRGLAVAAVSGAPLRIISQRSLVNLRGTGADGSYPPSQVQVATIAGPTTALVTRTDVAGDVIEPDMSAEQLLQDIVLGGDRPVARQRPRGGLGDRGALRLGPRETRSGARTSVRHTTSRPSPRPPP